MVVFVSWLLTKKSMRENENSTEPILTEIPINSVSKKALLESSKWGKWIAVANFSVALLLVLVTVQSILNDPESSLLTMDSSILLFVLYVGFLMSVFIIPAVFFWLFSTKIKSALTDNDPSTFVDAIFHLKSLYKFYGIWILIIFASIILLIAVVRLGFF